MEEKTKSCKNCIHLGIKEIFTGAQKESICTCLVCTVDQTYSTRFVLCDRHKLLQSERIIPYEIKIDASGLDVMLENFAVTLEATFNTEKIQRNAIANREIDELLMQLVDNEYFKKYKSWDNWLDNFKSYSFKCDSGISEIRGTINGMINEIKRLEKEEESKFTSDQVVDILDSVNKTSKDLRLKASEIIEIYTALSKHLQRSRLNDAENKNENSSTVPIDEKFDVFKIMVELYDILNDAMKSKTKTK